MISLTYSKVPVYLHASEFYRNLCSDDDFDVPIDCYRESDDNISTILDLCNIIRLMSYWGLKTYPQALLRYCFTNDYSQWKDAVKGDGLNHPLLSQAFSDSKMFTFQCAIETGCAEFTEFWLDSFQPNCEYGKNAIAQACRFGRLDLVQTLLGKGFPWDKYAYCAAAQYGHMHILEYLHENGCPFDNIATKFAARGYQLHCMKYLRFIGCPWNADITIEFAAPEYFYYDYDGFGSIPWSDDFSNSSVEPEYLKCLLFALENGCPIHPAACTRMCEYGRLDCLVLLHRYYGHWDKRTAAAAAAHGHLSCLQYLHENGCPWDEETIECAVFSGQVSCLIYAAEQGCPYNDNILEKAAGGLSIHCMQYLIEEQQILMTGAVLNAAILNGNYEHVVYLFDVGCPTGAFIANNVYERKNVDLDDKISKTLAYALNHGLQISEGLLQFVTQRDGAEVGPENDDVFYPPRYLYWSCKARVQKLGIFDKDEIFHYVAGGENRTSDCFLNKKLF